jgi:hypothetical protein
MVRLSEPLMISGQKPESKALSSWNMILQLSLLHISKHRSFAVRCKNHKVDKDPAEPQ